MTTTAATAPLTEGKGKEYLPRVSASYRDGCRQALEQGADLEPRAGASHAFRLVLPPGKGGGRKLPIAGGAGNAKSADPNVEAAFKTDLRNYGFIMDGLSTARGVPAGKESSRRVVIEVPRRVPGEDEGEPEEVEAPLSRRLRYEAEIMQAVQRINLGRHYAGMAEIRARAARDAEINSLDRLEFDAIVEREVGELLRAQLLKVWHLPTASQPYYSTPEWVPPSVAEMRERDDEPQRDVVAEPVAAAPTTQPGAAMPTIPREGWALLARAASAFAEFARLMSQQGENDDH